VSVKNIIQITLNEPFNATIFIPDSSLGETVTYRIIRAISGDIFASGNATFLGGNQWKVRFTPNIADVYIVEVSWGDIKYTRIFSTQTSPTVNQLYTMVVAIPDSQSGDSVAYVLYRASDGQALLSGVMTHVTGIHWKTSFSPASAGTFTLEVTDSTLSVVHSVEVVVAAVTVVTTAAITAATLLAQVNSAINARMSGGAVHSYTMPGGRNLQYIPLAELLQLRTQLQLEVTNASGGARSYAQFVDPI
jgi:hypothetical protein